MVLGDDFVDEVVEVVEYWGERRLVLVVGKVGSPTLRFLLVSAVTVTVKLSSAVSISVAVPVDVKVDVLVLMVVLVVVVVP